MDEGKLRAYLDGALPESEMERMAGCIASSPDTRAQLDRLRQNRDVVEQALDTLAPPRQCQSTAGQALERTRAYIARTSNSRHIGLLERIRIMSKNPLVKRYRPAMAGVAALVVIVALLSFAPVRALAGDLLKVFRVQRIEIVEVDTDTIKALEDDPRFQGLMDQLEPQIEMISKIEPLEVDSLAEAEAKVGFPVLEITALPEDLGPADNITVYRKVVAEIYLDKELLDAVFDAADIEIDLPDSIDETPIIVTQPDAVMQEWWLDGDKVMVFSQMTPPQVEYPDDLDLQALGAAGLQLLGVSREDAEALAATIDWTNTLVMPVPNKGGVSVSQVSVDGDGYLFTSQREEEEATVMWHQGDFSCFLNADYQPDQVLEIARSVQ